MKKLRVGIIGQGRSGRDIHRRVLCTQLNAMERFEVVAVSDTIPERCQPFDDVAIPQDFKVYPDYKDMLKDKSIDLIVNATRSMDHIPVSIEALKAGFHVLCEKPLAATVAAVDKVIAAARKAKRHFAVYQQSRFRPTFQKCMEIIKSGIIGEAVQVNVRFNNWSRRWDWQTLQEFDGGEVMNTAPHPLDMALQFYGDGEADPEKVVSVLHSINVWGDADSYVKMLLIGKGHPVIDLEVSHVDAFPGNVFEVYGTKGGLKADWHTVTWKYYRPEDAPRHELVRGTLLGPGKLPIYCGEALDWYEGSWTAPAHACEPAHWGDIYYTQLYDAIVKGKKQDVTVEQVRRQIKVIEECHRQNPLPRMKKGK